MFFVLKLIIIISLNNTYAYIMQNSEIILLPAWNPTGAKEISLTFKVFGKLMQLNLRRNDQVVSSAFEVWKNNAKDVTEKLSKLKASDSCFYLHKDHVSSAAINICQEHGLEGLIFVENNVLEIRSLWNAFAPLSFVDDFCVKEQINLSFGKPYLIKRSQQYFAGLDFYRLHKIRSKRSYVDKIWKNEKKFTIELAVFVDAEAYNSFMILLNFDIEEVLNMMLAYVNRIQALYHDPSLGVLIDILLVRLDFMEKQPSNLPTYSDNSSKMLESFCKYATKLNPPNDNDPRHWDIGLYITGLHIAEVVSIQGQKMGYDSGKFIKLIHGRAYDNSACNRRLSCAITTFPIEQIKNFAIISNPHEIDQLIVESSIRAAHEIGHLLGLLHDSKEECFTSSHKYIMCPIKKEYKVFEWSSLSHKMIKSKLKRKLCLLDHTKSQNLNYDGHYWSKYAFDNSTCHNYPGREQTAKAQCELFLTDKDANVVTLHDICQNLQCETPHKNKSYFAGRALNGTYCALGKECCDGKCVPVTEPPYIFKYCEEDNWSEWKEDICESSCLVKSQGVLVKRRFCEHQTRRTANCTGPYYDMVLCDNSTHCTEKRKTIAEFTIIKCNEFSRFAKNFNMSIKLLTASGIQFSHDIKKPWIACAIFCRRKDTPNWYAPRQEMLDFGVDPYFPDGTWCHNKDGQDYYCRQHYCLPENYSFVESEECKNNC